MDNSHFGPKGWHFRGYLPHFDGGEIAQSVTFRLADSLPRNVLERWDLELSHLVGKDLDVERRRRTEHYLDRGVGSAWLKDPSVAKIVEDALLYFDGLRYKLPAWVVMPNHIHVLLIVKTGYLLEDVMHSWKSFTSKEANKFLNRAGKFWQEEYFDRYIRHTRHYFDAIDYIEENPVKAGLCATREEWPFSSARIRGTLISNCAGKMPALPG
jgi:REP element-mobilizing transposase RayT